MNFLKNKFDVIVIGGGHAGVEACMASSKMGKKTLLLTNKINTLGQMSCNPAIGGIGKGHLVKEIDALGGLMAQAIDNAGIQFRTLNSSKGPAVQATRAQADRILYRQSVRMFLEKQKNLTILQQMVEDVIIKNNIVTGVISDMGLKLFTKTIILTVGTFLNGKIHIGTNQYSGGRAGDLPSIKLAQRLKEIHKRVGRLKTGTPPRIDKKSINFDKLIAQYSDNPLPMFSFISNKYKHPKQVPCHIVHTNEKTHELILENINSSAMYNGTIKSIGPRYCPSIEDKVIKFSERKSHQIFLEPEGLTSNEIYPNGISTSLPLDIQIKIVNSIYGLEKSRIIRPGYAIEYDFFDPRDLKSTLESKYIQGLFFAGQINGTTGYEEAAAQGILAGINAALLIDKKNSWVPRRDQAYIGVLVDDLCTLGINEPYRMFTSRAEHRLILREDNADLRLTEIGYKLGLVDEHRWSIYNKKIESIEIQKQKLKNINIKPNMINNNKINKIFKFFLKKELNGEELLKIPQINLKNMIEMEFLDESSIDINAMKQVEINIKYAGYILKQNKEIKKQIRNENTLLPSIFNYRNIHGLSNEVIHILNSYQPNSIGQASRISGITPAAISILLIFLKKQSLLKK